MIQKMISTFLSGRGANRGMNKLIQLHKEICIGLDFEIDSDWYNQCILNLILNNPFLSY